jgi:hypothetical protein
MGHQRHFERVRELVGRHTGVPEAEITPETRLVEDLRLGAEVGAGLLAAFADEFRVDLAAMAPLNYFDDDSFPAPVPSLLPLLAALSPRFRAWVGHAARGRRVLAVRGLVASARAGHWITPTLRPEQPHDRLTWRSGTAIAVALTVPLAVGTEAIARPSWTWLAVAVLILAALGLRLRADLARLRRLDAAAAREEAAVSAAG